MTARDRETAIAYLVSIDYDELTATYDGDCMTAGYTKAITMLVERFADVREEARAEAIEEVAAKFDETRTIHRHTLREGETDRDCYRCDADASTARRVRSLKPRSGT